MGSKQQQQQQQQQQQSQLYPSRLGSGAAEYSLHPHQHHHQLATAASFSSASNKKWVLNAKNDVVEVVADHHQGYTGGHFLMPGSGAANFSGPGFAAGGECGRGSTTTGSVLTRYNSAPSCLFSDLDQIARSLNDVAATTTTAATSAVAATPFDLPPLPSSAMAMSLDKRTNGQDLFPAGKKKIGGGGGGGSPSYSAQSSSSLAMDFSVVDHHHHQRPQQQQQNGFTGLLTGSPSSTGGANLKNTTSAAPPAMSMAAANLTRQSSSPASLLSRLEIDRVVQAQQQQHGSSEEDSLDGMDQEVMVASVSGAMDMGTVSSVDCGGFWDASSAGMAAVHPGGQLHGSVFLNGNSCPDQSGRKRIRDVELDMLDVALDHSGSSGGGGGGGGGGHQQQQQHHTLTRHLSLPLSTSRSSGGLLAAENLLQDSVPCRLRAKRGCATHPRSIAERVRRTRISERMRRLQELVPNMDKQTNTSDMLDEAVEYMKFLQKQVDDLQDCREKCQGLCRMSQQQNKTGSSGSQ